MNDLKKSKPFFDRDHIDVLCQETSYGGTRR